MEYLIYDYELGSTQKISAPGIVEAMLEYLPWPTVHLDIDYRPTNGQAKVIDKTTGFMYDIQAL